MFLNLRGTPLHTLPLSAEVIKPIMCMYLSASLPASNPCCQAGLDIANAIRSVSACPFLTDEEAAANPCRSTEEQCCRCCGFGYLTRKTLGEQGCLQQAGAFAQCGEIFDDCCFNRTRGIVISCCCVQ